MKISLSTSLFVAALAFIQVPAIAASNRTPAAQLLQTTTPGVKIYNFSSDPLVRSKQRAQLGLPAVKPPRLVKPGVAGSLATRICMDEDIGGGCTGIEEDFEMERFFMIDFTDTAGFRQQLETVVVYGSRCGVKVGNSVIGCADEPLFAEAELMRAGWVKETAEFLAGNIDFVVEIVTPLAEKCGRIAFDSQVTPDGDYGRDWYSAKDAILGAYAGNHGALSVGTRFDVSYPRTGDTIRFTISSLVGNGPVRPGSLNVVRMPGNAPAKNKCNGG